MATKKKAKKKAVKKTAAKKPMIDKAKMKELRGLVAEGKSILAERHAAKIIGEIEARKVIYKIQVG